MILIFDLDDTLYAERAYVESGLRAVARHCEARFGWDAGASFRFMLGVLDREGRGRIFDLLLEAHGRESRSCVAECVRVYRHHQPILQLDPRAEALLPHLAARHPLYLVTDGHKIVQQKKVEALGVAPMFRRVLITHRFGIRRAKPSTYCFELIRSAESCGWEDMAYIGDNPTKDFVSLNALGMPTVRVRTGEHRNAVARPGYDAQVTIPDLGSLPDVLIRLFPDARAGDGLSKTSADGRPGLVG